MLNDILGKYPLSSRYKFLKLLTYRKWLELYNCNMHDDILFDAFSMRYDCTYYKKRNRKRMVYFIIYCNTYLSWFNLMFLNKNYFIINNLVFFIIKSIISQPYYFLFNIYYFLFYGTTFNNWFNIRFCRITLIKS